jgi:hypothetical protein
VRRISLLATVAASLLSACGGTTTPTENAVLAAENAAGLDGDVVELPVESVPVDPGAGVSEWVGRWTGVEGTYLTIARGDAPGRYRLTMRYTLDDEGIFDGVESGDGIAFTRPDGAQTLRAGDGDATGLKYLAGKQDCLVVRQGEGYCRD